MRKGMIVILNGVSSSGKSTLAKMIQDRSGFPFYRLDIDDFILMAPEKFNDYDNKDFSVQFKFSSKFFHVVKLYSDLGFDLIVPYMFFKKSESLLEFKELLCGYPLLIVNIYCPVDELQRRENVRRDRKIGSASEQLALLETEFPNSISVNNYETTSENCADIIIREAVKIKRELLLPQLILEYFCLPQRRNTASKILDRR